MSIKEILGMRFKDDELHHAATSIVRDAVANNRRIVYFVNAHCVNVAARDTQYSTLLQNASELYADGIGMAIAARLWGVRLDNNVNGKDLFPLLCEQAARDGVPMGFFGAAPGVAEVCRECVLSKYPGLRVVFAHHGFVSDDEQDELIRSINDSDLARLRWTRR